MLDLNEKKELIIAQERKFAAQLGRHVLNKPQVHSWMIFIPFLFIFFIQDLMKYKKGRKEFSANYLLSNEKALQEAETALAEDRKPDTRAIAQKVNLSPTAQGKYADLMAVLADHYLHLLKVNGDSFEALVKSAYGNSRTNFLLFINQLKQAEKMLNQALMPKLNKTQKGAETIINKMEEGSNILRRELAEEIFGKA